MSKIRNILLLFIILVTIFAAGMKWLMSYYTEKTAKDIQASLPPGMFKYSGTSAPLNGKLSIDNIRINIAGEEATIAKVELASKNILDPIRFLIKNWGQHFPNELAFNIKSLTINTNSLISQRSIFNLNRLSLPLNIPCGRVKALSFAEIVAMGYHQLTFDVHFAYKFVAKNHIKMNLTLNAPNVIRGQFSYYGDVTSFIQKPKETKINDFEQHSIKYTIPTFKLTITDFPLLRKLYNYCATNENQLLDEFIKNIDSPSKVLIDQQTTAKFNLIVNQEIIDALNNYQKDPKDFYLAIQPTKPTTLQELRHSDEASMLNTLRPKLRINGQNIDINVQWSRAKNK